MNDDIGKLLSGNTVIKIKNRQEMFYSKDKDFGKDVTLEMNEEDIEKAKTDNIVLFGNIYKMYSDEWKHHIHLKVTDMCDANCKFCIEKSARNNPYNTASFFKSANKLLRQMYDQRMLRTVSITGGEPTLWKPLTSLLSILGSYPITLLSINTNGYCIESIPSSYDGWINISKHAIDDSEIFNRGGIINKKRLQLFRKTHKKANIRFQSVLGVEDGMQSVEDILYFINTYKDSVDDFSFRSLIIEKDFEKIPEIFTAFRNYLFEKAAKVNQTVQDYYVYEVFDLSGVSITISYSNMFLLKKYNETHDNNFLEEIIVHPDGYVTGSWDKKTLILYKPGSTVENKYIPCKGIGCEHPCARKIETVSTISEDSCGSTDSCTDTASYSSVINCGSVDSCR